MKKILVLLLAASISLTMTACINTPAGGTETTTVSDDAVTTLGDETAETTENEETEETTTEAEEEKTGSSVAAPQIDSDKSLPYMTVTSDRIVAVMEDAGTIQTIEYVFVNGEVSTINTFFKCESKEVAELSYQMMTEGSMKESMEEYYTNMQLDGDTISAQMIDEIVEEYKGLDVDTIAYAVSAQFDIPYTSEQPGGDISEDGDSYSVILNSCGDSKVAVISAVKDYLEIGLADAKNLVEAAPVTLADGLTQTEAEEFLDILEDEGADAEIKADSAADGDVDGGSSEGNESEELPSVVIEDGNVVVTFEEDGTINTITYVFVDDTVSEINVSFECESEDVASITYELMTGSMAETMSEYYKNFSLDGNIIYAQMTDEIVEMYSVADRETIAELMKEEYGIA